MKINATLYKRIGNEIERVQKIEDFQPQHNILAGSDEVFPNAKLISFIAYAYPSLDLLEVCYLQDREIGGGE